MRHLNICSECHSQDAKRMEFKQGYSHPCCERFWNHTLVNIAGYQMTEGRKEGRRGLQSKKNKKACISATVSECSVTACLMKSHANCMGTQTRPLGPTFVLELEW
jgi:hypothetical protein